MRAREHRLGLASFSFTLLVAACSGADGRADVGILDPGRRDGMATDTAGLDWGGADGASDASNDSGEGLDAVVDNDATPVDLVCDDDSDCPAALPYCDAIMRLCIECVGDLSCGPDRACQAGRCVDLPCTPDEKKCAGSVKKLCNHLGTGWASEDCAPKECAGGECVGCTPGAVRCSGDSVEECTGAGFWAFSVECPALCYEGACHACMPGKLACDQGAKGTLVVKCDDTGETTAVVEDCNPDETGNVCQSGKCTSLCLDNLKLNTNMIPTEQFRADYVFLVPNKYASDYVSIVAGVTTTVTLDGAALAASGAAPAGASGYVVYRQAIADGVHTLSADKPVMAYVYGYDVDVSYGYPAGANVVAINPAGM